VYVAKLAEQTEDFQQMHDMMKMVVEFGQELDQTERNLMSVAFKNCVNQRRTALRALKAIHKRETSKKSKHLDMIELQKKKLESEMTDYCKELIALLDDKILSTASSPAAKVFWFKMKGDYYRYLTEMCEAATSKVEYGKLSNEAYKQATDIATTGLAPTCPIRLGLALNYSVYFYEIEDNPSKACEMAKRTFDDAIGNLEEINADDYKDSTTIMQLLRDNLTLWTQ
jgi:14-3-3 protein epsilon